MKKLRPPIKRRNDGTLVAGGFILTSLQCDHCGEKTDHFHLPMLRVYECVACATRRPP